MLEAVWKHGVLFYAVGVMCILGIFSKIIVSLTLRRLVREAGRMGKSLQRRPSSGIRAKHSKRESHLQSHSRSF